MFDKMTLVIAQAKEMAIEDSKAWNFLSEEDKQTYMDKSEAALTELFNPEIQIEGWALTDESIGRVMEIVREEHPYNCDKCQDKGYTELEGGTIQLACDCPAVDAYRAKMGLPVVDPSASQDESNDEPVGTKWILPEGKKLREGEYICQICSDDAGKTRIHTKNSKLGIAHKVS